MKLDVDLSLLHKAVQKMQAEAVDFELGLEQSEIDPIDIALEEGVEVDLKDIAFNSGGLATYQGRQILLYIQDHGGRKISEALEDGSSGNKFHVFDCKTLRKMKARGRFDRYVVTNTLSGKFKIFGVDWQTNAPLEGETDLKVCKNCLSGLNYQDYTPASKGDIFNNFSIEEFFSTYSSFFKHMPKYRAGEQSVGYSDDWESISKRIRAENNYDCSQCGVHLSKYRRLLHTHHISGNKSDNSTKNLSVLCVDCHRKQPSHGHMFVKHEDTLLINTLRKEQNKIDPSSWDKVDRFADPALNGVIAFCKTYNLPSPELGVSVASNITDELSKLDLAWPKNKIAVVIKNEGLKQAKKDGWDIWPVFDTLDDFTSFADSFRYK